MKKIIFTTIFFLLCCNFAFAVKNITGARTTESWNDGDHITGNVSVAAGNVISVDVGATIDFTGNYSIAMSGATMTCVGTVANPIIFKSSAADPGVAAWIGWIAGAASNTWNFQYTKFYNGGTILNFANYLPTAFTWNNNYLENCTSVVAMASLNQTVSLTFGPTMCVNMASISPGSALGTVDTTINNWYLLNAGPIIAQSGTGAIAVNKSVSTMSPILSASTMSFIALGASSAGASTITDCYAKGTQFGIQNNANPANACNVTQCVFYNLQDGINVGDADQTTVSSYNDAINLTRYGMVRTAGSLDSDYDYVCGCFRRPFTLGDTTANTQVSGVGASYTRDNELSYPNKPLEVDGVTETSIGSTSAQITFDSKLGNNGAGSLRIDAIGFLEYGTTSGALTENSFNGPFPNAEEIGLCWVGLSTKHIFATTGHTVTINNLTPNTTIFYRCGLLDPLGRVGYSAEGSFTTTTTDVVVSAIASDDYSPAYTDNITITCTTDQVVTNVVAVINDRQADMDSGDGLSWSTGSIVAGATFGDCTGATIYIAGYKTTGEKAYGAGGTPITIEAPTEKTTALISEVTASLASAGYTATVTLIGEEDVAGDIMSLIKISVPTYSVSTIDGIRTAVAASSGGWTGSVTATEYSTPTSGTNSIVIYKMVHS